MPKENFSLEEKLIGRITHYFSHLEVAVIELSDVLSVGDKIRVVGGQTDFEQEVDSMEIDRQKVQKAKSGDAIGLKVAQKVREGYKVYKI